MMLTTTDRVPIGIFHDDASFSMRTSKNNKEESALVFFPIRRTRKKRKDNYEQEEGDSNKNSVIQQSRAWGKGGTTHERNSPEEL